MTWTTGLHILRGRMRMRICHWVTSFSSSCLISFSARFFLCCFASSSWAAISACLARRWLSFCSRLLLKWKYRDELKRNGYTWYIFCNFCSGKQFLWFPVCLTVHKISLKKESTLYESASQKVNSFKSGPLLTRETRTFQQSYLACKFIHFS